MGKYVQQLIIKTNLILLEVIHCVLTVDILDVIKMIFKQVYLDVKIVIYWI